jgi:hypothetical protein
MLRTEADDKIYLFSEAFEDFLSIYGAARLQLQQKDSETFHSYRTQTGVVQTHIRIEPGLTQSVFV